VLYTCWSANFTNFPVALYGECARWGSRLLVLTFFVIVLSRGFFFVVAKLLQFSLSHFAKSVLSVGFET
ncbi:TPA: hypothetical protein ACMDTJ_004603, partial [Vibrio parahaemolyticus]